MAKSRTLKFLCGIMATVFLATGVTFGSVWADDITDLGDNIEIGDNEGNDDIIISEELDDETDETKEETDEINEETTENEQGEENNTQSEGKEESEEGFKLQSTGSFAPGGDKRLPNSTYQPWMPNATVIEAKFDELPIGTHPLPPGHVPDNWITDTPRSVPFTVGADGFFRYHATPENSTSNRTQAFNVEGEPFVFEVDGIRISRIFGLNNTSNATGGYFNFTVPEGVTAARLTMYAFNDNGARWWEVRKDGVRVADFYAYQGHNRRHEPSEQIYDLPGGGDYVLWNGMSGQQIWLMRMEYSFDARPAINPGSFSASIKPVPGAEHLAQLDPIPNATNDAGVGLSVDWSGNIGWDGFDQVTALAYNQLGARIPPNGGLVNYVKERAWTGSVGKNTPLTFSLNLGGDYRVVLLGTRAIGVIEPEDGKVPENFEEGTFMLSEPTPPKKALFDLDPPVIKSAELNRHNANEFIIKWSDVYDVQQYRIQYRLEGTTDWAEVGTKSPNSPFPREYVLNVTADGAGNTLKRGETYDFRVGAFRHTTDKGDETKWSEDAQIPNPAHLTQAPVPTVRAGLTTRTVAPSLRTWFMGTVGKGSSSTEANGDNFILLYRNANAVPAPTTAGVDDNAYARYAIRHNTNYAPISVQIDDKAAVGTDTAFPGKIYMKSGAGTKYTDGHNGFSYFYTEIDPERQNWRLKAEFKIAPRLGESPVQETDNQSAFGVIATDIAPLRDMFPHMNSITSGLGRHIYVDNTGSRVRVEGMPGLIVKAGWTDPTGLSSPHGLNPWGTDTMSFDRFYRASFENDAGVKWDIGETFVLELEKDNFGFHAKFISATLLESGGIFRQYIDPTGDNYGGATFTGNPLHAYGDLVKIDASGNYVTDEGGRFISIDNDNDPGANYKYMPDYALRVQDPDRYYAGLFISRKMAAEITNIEWEENNPLTQERPDPSVNPRPEKFMAKSLSFDASSTTGARNYDAAFISNVTGTLIISDENYRTISGPHEIVGNERLEVPLVLEEGTNTFYANAYVDTSKPQVGLPFGFSFDPRFIDEPVERRFSITVRNLGSPANALFVSPGGTVTGSGTRNDPMNLREAINYSQPGQQIVMLEGTYYITSRLNIGRGNDGGTLMADPGAKVVIDLLNSRNGGIDISGDDWHLFGFTITDSNPPSNQALAKPIQVSGHNNRVEQITVHDVGDTAFAINGVSTEPPSMWPSGNMLISCVARNAVDASRNNADGYAIKNTVGEGTYLKYCISAFNVDDGYDFFATAATGPIGTIRVDSCVAYANGLPSYDYDENGGNFSVAMKGDGNGFKMGGAHMPGAHELTNSLAFFTYTTAVSSNSGSGIKVYNNTLFRNARGMNLYSNYAVPPEEREKFFFSADNNLLIESGEITIQNNRLTQIGNVEGAPMNVISNGQTELNEDGSVKYGVYDPDSSFYVPTAHTVNGELWYDMFNSNDPSNPFKEPTINPDGTINMHGFLLPTENHTAQSDTRSRIVVNPLVGADFRNLKPHPGSVITLKPERSDTADGGGGIGGSGAAGRRGGGGGGAAPGVVATGTGGVAGSLSTRIAVSAVESAVAAAVAQAQEAGRDTANVNVNVRFANVAVVTGETFAAMAAASNESGGRITLTIDSLTADKSRVDVRVIVDVTKANETLNLSGTTTGAVPRQIKERFDKFFSNVALVIQLGQNGSYGQEATVAARAPGITNGERVNFYSYDRATNK
ncbi:MAG: fibronectin type III domain-containing protein, partial [Oscillospiraceae bacterium]|nr:fibronectin type III domain-containing protein [Oscillospiraceae bacterium]